MILKVHKYTVYFFIFLGFYCNSCALYITLTSFYQCIYLFLLYKGNEEDDQFDIASLPNNFAHRPASSKPALNKNNSYASGVSGGGLLNPIPTITTQIKPFEVRVPTGELRRSPSTETRKTPSMDRESHVEEEEPMAMNRPSVAHGSGSAVDMKDLIAKVNYSSFLTFKSLLNHS